ncbi:AAA family ATPase [Streptomyces sp. SID12501]|uniref:AAA family ATPase n=1 Tax=Streptomyces sp. SID12501 TaxID=2706042 RepID=A0A6B3BUF0_9ACTN|nr:LuxR family transcriptional regulator [Streptomyces sp. SID12501]NEC88004.1 AAA family ATPase [Streptomyces sp. SID12501]
MTDEARGKPVGGLPGRAREVAILRAVLAGESDTWCVAVTGEPGIGKSRLLTELGKLADTAGWTVRSGRAAEFESRIPFGVFVNALDDQLAELGPERLAALGQQQLALLATMFPALPASGPTDLVDAERYRLHRAVRALLELLAEPSGLVLVFDDLHWADEGSVELLDHLLRHPPQARLVLALASRPRQTSLRLWHALSRAATDGVAELLELAPLSQADAGRLMPERLGRSRREELYQASGGNPFYLEALVRAGERGIPVGDAALHPDGAIPVAVRAVLAAELAALTPQERVVAHAAAVVGDDFEADSLAETAAMDPGSVLAVLDRLAERDLVRLDGATGRFRYRHPLVRSIAYQDAGPGWRLQAHGRAASALRSRGAPPAEFARHVERSAVRGDLDAVAALTEAAEATMHTTPMTAGHFLRAAIRLLPDSETATPQRLILLGRLAQALGATGDLRQARETMYEVLRLLPAELTQIRAQTARACATVEQILGHYTEARAMLHSEWKRVEGVDARSAAVLLVALVAGESVEREHGQDRVAEAIAAAREVGDPMLLATALSAATLIDRQADRLDEAAALLDALPDSDLVCDIDAAFWLSWSEISADRLTAASRHVSRGLRLARESRQSHKIALLTAIRGMVHAYLGELAAATTCFDDSLESAELTGSEELRVMALTFGCWITTWRGDLAEAIRLGKEAIVADDQATAMSSWRSGQAEAMLAQAMLHSGDPHACIDLLLTHGGGAELPAVGVRTRPLVYLMLTEAEVAAGRIAAATAWADRAEVAAGRLDLPLRTAMAQQARAIATLPTDPAAAAPLAVAAAGTFGRIGVAVEAGRAHLLAATAFGGSGAIDQARAHLMSARALFTRCDARLFLPQVAREERRLNARGPRPESGVERFDLTAREVEMANLASDGLTNRDIGLRLNLSPKTVEVHLGRVYTKVGVSGRTALAGVWAAAARD